MSLICYSLERLIATADKAPERKQTNIMMNAFGVCDSFFSLALLTRETQMAFLQTSSQTFQSSRSSSSCLPQFASLSLFLSAFSPEAFSLCFSPLTHVV
jgi:hypothetical protein